MKSSMRFLSLFSQGLPNGFVPTPTPEATPPVAPVVAPAFAPSSTVPAGMVVDIAAAIAERHIAKAALTAAQQPAPVVQPTVTPPAPDLATQVAELRRTNADNAAQIENLRLSNYAANAINAARAGGKKLIDGLVHGKTTQEIDASVQYAVAEYALIEQQTLATVPAPVPVAPVPVAPVVVPAAAPIPQGTVTSTQVAPVAAPAEPPAPAPLSLPGFVAAPGIPEGGQVITQEQLAYLTSNEAVRNGDYAKNRNMINQALRGGLKGAPGQFTFSGGNVPTLAPPVSAQAPGVQPAMQHSAYAGMSVPTVAPGPGMTAPTRGVPSTAFAPGRAPQPSQFQQEVAPGQYTQTGAPDAGQVNAARAAAEASLPSARAAAARQPPLH